MNIPIPAKKQTKKLNGKEIKHAEVGLGAHHSPDVFHVQQEIVKGTSGALTGVVKGAEKQVETATKQVQKEIQAKEVYDKQAKNGVKSTFDP